MTIWKQENQILVQFIYILGPIDFCVKQLGKEVCCLPLQYLGRCGGKGFTKQITIVMTLYSASFN